MGNKIFMEKGKLLELKTVSRAKLNGWYIDNKFKLHI